MKLNLYAFSLKKELIAGRDYELNLFILHFIRV